MKSWFGASGSTTRGLLVEPTMGRSESSSQNFAFLLWGSQDSADHFCGLIAGLLSRGLLACSVCAVHCGFMAVTSRSKFSISFSAWRVTENSCGTGFGCSLLFGLSVCLGLVGPASFPHCRGVCVCIVSLSVTAVTEPSLEWLLQRNSNHLAFTSLSISISHSVLDPEEVAVGKTWQAFWGFGCYFLCFHNFFLLLGKLKFGTCKLLLTLVPQQVRYACVR